MKTLIVTLLFFLANRALVNFARADDLYSAAFKPCSNYSSPATFVRESSLFCLTQARSEVCEREAKKYFTYCGFDGQYSRLSQRAFADLLKLLLLGKAQNLTNVAAK